MPQQHQQMQAINIKILLKQGDIIEVDSEDGEDAGEVSITDTIACCHGLEGLCLKFGSDNSLDLLHQCHHF